MTPADTAERRRIAVIDGPQRYELAVPADVALDAALRRIGIPIDSGRYALLDRSGREIPVAQRAEDLADGLVLTVVDLDERPARTTSRAVTATQVRESVSPWSMLAAFGILLAIIALAVPEAIPPVVRVLLVVVAGGGAVASAVVWGARARRDEPLAGAASLGPLTLAFAAGVVAVPPLPAGTPQLAVFTGFAVAAVLSSVLSIIVRAAVVRAELGTATIIFLSLAALWGAALLLGLPTSAAASVALGAVPVALRALPSTLLDVSPGMFIDFSRFQTTRWTVRQDIPEEAGPIAADTAKRLVDASSARLVVGTTLLSGVAALSAPAAIPDFAMTDPLVFAGRIALAVCASLALLLGARRASSGSLRWMPQLAAVVVITVAVVAAVRAAGPLWLTVAAGVVLVVAIVVAVAVVPVGRGASSLFWSRFGDIVEWIAVALALPAGLLAADAIDVLRGMMAT